MMKTKDEKFVKKLYKIDENLSCMIGDNDDLKCIFYSFNPPEKRIIYIFGNNKFYAGFNDMPTETQKSVANLIHNYFYDLPITMHMPDNNSFKKYTDHLAETLQAKNAAYGDSFTKSVDDYGLKVIGIRLSDKYNRIKHLVNAGSLKENDESLEDTLLDMAGYSILALKYLKEHKNE